MPQSTLGVILGGSVVIAISLTACGSPPKESGFANNTGPDGSADGSLLGDDSGGFQYDGNGGFVVNEASAPVDAGGGDAAVVCPAGLQCNVPCPPGSSTTISGTVYDPAVLNPLYNIAVYIPQRPLEPLPKGIITGADACSCGALFKSGSVVGTTTDAAGKFTLTNAPVGTNVQLVLQVGKWRRVVTIPTVTACTNNALPDKSLALNATVAPGSNDNMPDIAVSTGHSDTLECLMKRIGLPNTEFVAGTGTTGHVHLYNGGYPMSGHTGVPTGGIPTPEVAPMPGAPESDKNLWDTQAHLMPYDILLLSCEGGPTYNANPPVLESYLNAGGRAFASHYHFQWFTQTAATITAPSTTTAVTPADWMNLATWTGGGTGNPADGVVVQTLNVGGGPFPKGIALKQWLGNVGGLVTAANPVAGVATGDLPIYQPKVNAIVTPANTPSQSWITTQSTGIPPVTLSDYFSFDTPVGGPNYCGRAVFSGLHVDGAPAPAASAMDNPNPPGTLVPPPQGCAAGALSPQEEVIEFMLFDLSSCVIPDTMKPPTTIPVY
jgi:hypothetical protein